MSKFLFSITFLLCALFSKAESLHLLDSIPPNPDTEEIFSIVSEMPHYKGCETEEGQAERKLCTESKIIDFISTNLSYPEKARSEGTEGMAVIRFNIMRDGSLHFPENAILKDPGDGCGNEALRVLKLMPNWVPGKQEGEAVNVQFTMPIKFKLTGNKSETTEFVDVTIDWASASLKGQRRTADVSNYTKAEWTLDEATKLLSNKEMGFPVFLRFGEKNGGYTQYYISVEKSGKKDLVYSDSKNKGLKKKILKVLAPGKTIYFYNWEYKKSFLEITIK